MNYLLCDSSSEANWQRLLAAAVCRQIDCVSVTGGTADEEFTENFELNKSLLFCEFCRAWRGGREAALYFTDITFQFLPLYYSFLKNRGCGRISFYGFAHGGFYEPWDLQRILPRYAGIERELLAYFKKIFVQTNYHKELICLSYPELESRIAVSGLPLPAVEFRRPQKRYRAAYFSRPSPDKGIDFVPDGVDVMRLPKELYYRTLSQYRAVLVPARKETFGYVALESVLCGTLPVVPYDFCYPEIFGDSLIYFDHHSRIGAKIDEICALDDETYHREVERLRAKVKALKFEVTP